MISNGTLSQSKINERYFLMHPEFFIFDRMTIIRRSASYITYKEASLVKTNNNTEIPGAVYLLVLVCMHASRNLRIERAGGPLSSWLIIIFIL